MSQSQQSTHSFTVFSFLVDLGVGPNRHSTRHRFNQSIINCSHLCVCIVEDLFVGIRYHGLKLALDDWHKAFEHRLAFSRGERLPKVWDDILATLGHSKYAITSEDSDSKRNCRRIYRPSIRNNSAVTFDMSTILPFLASGKVQHAQRAESVFKKLSRAASLGHG